MSFVIAAPELVTAAATDLSNIGSTLSVANAAAVPPTTGVLAAAEDEVSAAIASLFSGHAQAYQVLGAPPPGLAGSGGAGADGAIGGTGGLRAPGSTANNSGGNGGTAGLGGAGGMGFSSLSNGSNGQSV